MYQYIDNERTALHLIILYIPLFKFLTPQYFGLFTEAQHIRYPILQKNSQQLVSLYFLCVLLQRRQTIYINVSSMNLE